MIKEMPMYKVISLFSGTGGSSLGYKLAGLDVVLSNEFVEAAWKCYEANFPKTICLHDDIRKLTGDIILSKVGFKQGELDILDGSPPCFEADVLVMTDKGYKKIQNIQEGDYVLTHKNRFRKVIKTFRSVKDTIYEVKTMGTIPFKVTGNHPFYVRRKHIKAGKKLPSGQHECKRYFDEPEWKNISDLDKDYYIGIAIDGNLNKKIPKFQCAIKINQVQYKTQSSLPLDNKDFWWIVGRWIGDGWTRFHENEKTDNKYRIPILNWKKSRHITRICCAKTNEEVNEIKSRLENLFIYSLTEKRTTYRFNINDVELTKFLRQFGTDCYNKKLTKDIFNLPEELLKSFLDGYLSADGTQSNSKFNIIKHGFSTVSKELFFGILSCIQKVYHTVPTISVDDRRNKVHFIEGRKVNCTILYTGRFDFNIGHSDEAFYENGYLWTPFRSSSLHNWNNYVYNLEVEEDNSYTVYNLIVHNCVAFSTAGKRQEKWGKVTKYSDTEQRCDDLLFEYARILGEIQPKVFVVENVAGLGMGEAKKIFNQAKKAFEDQGYNVEVELLNARRFNVPQNRPRIIFIGIRKDFNTIPTHPKPQTADIPIKAVLKDVVNTPQDIEDSKYPEHYSVMKYLKQMKPGEAGSDYNEKGSYFGLIRLDWDKPANTILQSDAKHISCSAIHPVDHRKLTIPELKRISSFPDDFILNGDYKQNWERIGRAVPPNMMKAIAEHIRYKILDKINNIQNDYNPPYYDKDLETTGQQSFDFGDEFKTGFKKIK